MNVNTSSNIVKNPPCNIGQITKPFNYICNRFFNFFLKSMIYSKECADFVF